MERYVHAWNQSADKDGKINFGEMYYVQSQTDNVWM